MKFEGNRQSLLEAFSLVGAVVPPRAIKPVLQNVRVVVDGSGATLEATDLEVALRCRVELEAVHEPGELLVPAARLVSILRESGGSDVRAHTEDGTLVLQCGRGNFRVLGEPVSEFPDIPAFESDSAFVIPRDQLRILIKKTIFATAREKMRFAFNGVRLELSPQEVRMIATDGKRLAVKSFPIENPDGIEAGVIVPVKGLSTLEKALSDEDAEVQVAIQDKQVVFKSSATEISSRLIEGAFPRYQSVLPPSFVAEAQFDKNELVTALRQASTLTNEESRSVRMVFEEDVLTLRSRAMDVGEAQVNLPISLEGHAIESSFNADFMVEGLKATDSDAISIRLSGKDTPAQLAGEEGYIYVVMPITLRSG